MRAPRLLRFLPARPARQRGVSLFFALVSLVAISLAAIMLVRSVDTSTLISGNLAFQQSATASADAGTEAAIAWMAQVVKDNTGLNVLNDPLHPFNITDKTKGYYSSIDDTSLTAAAGFKWDDTDSKALPEDSTGNVTRYIIQRMCRNFDKPVKDANCLYSGAILDESGQHVPLPQEICKCEGCPVAGQTPQVRITSRTEGPKNTRSYVQAFVY
jgi:type IV pilus assembly protein PilX